MAKGMPGFFDLNESLLSTKGDDLERIKALVDFEIFRKTLEVAVPRADRAKGGRLAFDHVLMFKVLIKDRLSFMRFVGLGLADAVPDANTIWMFREALKKAQAIDALFARFDSALRAAGIVVIRGQILDAIIIAGPSSAYSGGEASDPGGAHSRGECKQKPAKLAEKDCDVRWTVKYTKAAFDGWRAARRSRHSRVRQVWADSAFRSAKNEVMLARRGFAHAFLGRSRKASRCRSRTRLANVQKSKVRSAVEHVLTHQKRPMGLVVRTIGMARAKVKIGHANLAYHMRRVAWLSARAAAARGEKTAPAATSKPDATQSRQRPTAELANFPSSILTPRRKAVLEVPTYDHVRAIERLELSSSIKACLEAQGRGTFPVARRF